MNIKRYIPILLVLTIFNNCSGDEGPSTEPGDELAIISVSPDEGEPGTSVTISGSGFSTVASENITTFGKVQAEVSSSTESQIETTVPDGAVTGEVAVTVAGERAGGPAFTVLESGPVITSVEPDSGKWRDDITITGENFAEFSLDNIVTFNGVEATVLSSSSTELVVNVPKGAGDGRIQVSVGGKSSEGADFNYLLTVLVSTWAGGAQGYADGPGVHTARFAQPAGIGIDTDGYLYVGDFGNNVIRKIDPDRAVSTYAGTGSAGDADGDVASAEFRQPAGVEVASDGTIYVADQFGHRIRKITTDGTVSTIAGDGTAGDTDDTGTAAQFNFPVDVAVTSEGVIFVADYFNHKIRKITPDGTVSTFAGDGTEGFADGAGSSAQFYAPYSLALSPDESTLYVADLVNHAIRTVDVATGEVGTLAGDGTSANIDGSLEEARFATPGSIAVDADGTIFVAQNDYPAIRMIKDGVVTTIAGTAEEGFREGEGDISEFDTPRYLVAVNEEDRTVLYVCDSNNHRIRRITIE